MALETTLVYETEMAVSMNCADGTAIPKGSILKIADGLIVSVAGTDDDPVIGIAKNEKIANDGNTQISVYLGGVFKGTAGAAGVTAGDYISSDASTGDDNEMATIGATEKNAIGMAMTTATDLQTFIFKLAPCLGQP